MPDQPPRCRLQAGDTLIRKVSPGQWYDSPYEADPVAFEPKDDGLSLFFAALASPYGVLDFFSQFRGVWHQVGPHRRPTVQEMIHAG